MARTLKAKHLQGNCTIAANFYVNWKCIHTAKNYEKEESTEEITKILHSEKNSQTQIMCFFYRFLQFLAPLWPWRKMT